MSIRCLWLLPLLGCQAKADQPSSAAPTGPTLIEVREGDKVIASIRPGKPCRATIGPTEMIVGGPPLVSQVGSTLWSGTDATNGTTISRDGDRVVRLFPTTGMTLGVFDLQGVPVVRVQATADGAVVSDASLTQLRKLEVKGATIHSDHPPLVVSGTHDLVIASVLSSPELSPEVRMLAACERVLVTEKKEL